MFNANCHKQAETKDGKQVYHYLGVAVQKPSVRRSMAQVNLLLPQGAFDGYDGDQYIVYVPTGLQLNGKDFNVIFGLNREDRSLQLC